VNWTSYASCAAILLVFLSIPSASGYFYSQPSEAKRFSECGEAGCVYDVTVGGNTFPLWYDIVNDIGSPDARTAEITEVTADTEKKALTISLTATHWGKLYVGIPRDLLDASDGTQDTSYIVLMNGQDAGNDVVEVTRILGTSDDVRVLSIRYGQGQKQIEIVGTQIVPEFGLGMLVATLAMIGAVGATIYASRRIV
jgi:hypothetical protein